jgi:hypothetical protein
MENASEIIRRHMNEPNPLANLIVELEAKIAEWDTPDEIGGEIYANELREIVRKHK